MVGLLTVSLGLGLYQCDMHRDSDAYWRPRAQDSAFTSQG